MPVIIAILLVVTLINYAILYAYFVIVLISQIVLVDFIDLMPAQGLHKLFSD